MQFSRFFILRRGAALASLRSQRKLGCGRSLEGRNIFLQSKPNSQNAVASQENALNPNE
jgi:hypothetical protein